METPPSEQHIGIQGGINLLRHCTKLLNDPVRERIPRRKINPASEPATHPEPMPAQNLGKPTGATDSPNRFSAI
ncbi:MAG: hypothetical protein KatS3mg082_2773 [Nitrospiraceae bacterium]|nr:MAG: hypothetical protein KatS3mg082_2773 [Nitrospiraceae bacterium]